MIKMKNYLFTALFLLGSLLSFGQKGKVSSAVADMNEGKLEKALQEINETIDPNEQPRVMKALPVGSSPKPEAGTLPPNKRSSSAASKTHPKASPSEVRRAVPVDQRKKK
jgi:hypothetical protein